MDRGRTGGDEGQKQEKLHLNHLPLDFPEFQWRYIGSRHEGLRQDSGGRRARIDFPDIWAGDIFLTIDWLRVHEEPDFCGESRSQTPVRWKPKRPRPL